MTENPQTPPNSPNTLPDLRGYAWLSVAAAIATILLKTWAWRLTGSVGLLSDALESGVNLAGALMTLWMLSIAAKPEDEDHAYGHSKAEYFSSAFEGVLILLAAVSIGVTAALRFFAPQPLTGIDMGIVIALLAAAINFGVARILSKAGKRHNAIALTADAKHLETDVWTSIGVVAGLIAVWASGYLWLDAAIALAVAFHIAWTGVTLIRRSVAGLMDASLGREHCEKIEAALAPFRARGISFHALRTREAGARAFISVHVLVPGAWTVQQGHDEVEQIEAAIRARLPRSHITTHLEPIEDPVSQADQSLDRA